MGNPAMPLCDVYVTHLLINIVLSRCPVTSLVISDRQSLFWMVKNVCVGGMHTVPHMHVHTHTHTYT